MAWRIAFARSVERELARLDREAAKRILGFLRHRVSPLDDSRAIGEALKGSRLGKIWNTDR